MPGGNQFQIDRVTLHPSSVETADGDSDFTFKSGTSRAISIWLDVTAVSGTTPSLDMIVETSIEDETGPFVEQASILLTTATGTFTVTINRADQALGRFIRVRFVITGTTPSFTLEVQMERME